MKNRAMASSGSKLGFADRLCQSRPPSVAVKRLQQLVAAQAPPSPFPPASTAVDRRIERDRGFVIAAKERVKELAASTSCVLRDDRFAVSSA
jgi:hypothetical protein